jgi:hypothetical protein
MTFPLYKLPVSLFKGECQCDAEISIRFEVRRPIIS